MKLDLLDENSKQFKVTVIPYRDGFRASLKLVYKDGTKDRIQKYSSTSPDKAIEKVYKEANEKYYKKLRGDEDKIVFSPETNKELMKLEKSVSADIVAETKNNLNFTSVSKEWLNILLAKTNKNENNRGISMNTFEYYRSMTHGYLNVFFEKYKVNKLTLEIVQKVFDSKVDLGFKTLKGLRSALAQILDYSKKKGYIQENFARDIELPEANKVEIDFYNEKQQEQFRSACERDGRVIAMLFYINLALGLRPEEGCGLKWNRIKFAESEDELTMIKIDNAVKVVKVYDENHKIIGGKKIDDELKSKEAYRTLPLRKEYDKVLREFKEKEKKRLGKYFREDGYVFLNRNREPYTSEILTNKMPEFTAKWKLPHITPYGLRHSFASLMAKLGVKESVLKVLMGHKEITTTHKYYIHLTDEDIMNEVMFKTNEKKEKSNEQQLNETNVMMLDKINEIMKLMQMSNQMAMGSVI